MSKELYSVNSSFSEYHMGFHDLLPLIEIQGHLLDKF